MACTAFSGTWPSHQEIRHGRELIDRLPRDRRRDLEREDVLGILAPLLCGFRFSREADFVDGANRHLEGATVFGRLLDEDPVTVVSPLCAHRESASIAKARLADVPFLPAARRALALLASLAGNSRCSTAQVRLLQQPPTERASSCLRPQVFARYADAGEVDVLLHTLRRHQEFLATVAQEYCRPGLAITSSDLDPLSTAADAALDRELGPTWSRARTIPSPWAGDAVVDNALSDALPHVRRLMPEIGELAFAVPSSREHSPDARQAVEWFAGRTEMTPLGRAIYEFGFYREWARSVSTTAGIGIGLDRDWSRFQRLAWEQAFAGQGVPLLYARRTSRPSRADGLAGLSFRQFWRAPDDEESQS
ncbi:hypothetical protein [Microlunatus soli]|uniref:hypothetical protein n=1 Tax=Microlunatus soli TaxID=630515 RepID=UPI0012F9B03A|nr:hypothetical protein [Microlunatus soli]